MDATTGLHDRVLDWYAENARDLPWRSEDVSPWAVLVSEVMLQQTPVARVLPVWTEWVRRWPTPGDLAAAGVGEAVRAWGRLGYPRRALRLHAAATAIGTRHAGVVPRSYEDLRALPGVGDYTAAAVASFAHRQRHVVLDTNVRRVLARTVGGAAVAAPTVTKAERALAASLLPDDPEGAARWAVAVMELGALVCTSASPRCTACPVADLCLWKQLGRPAAEGPARPAQGWAGTDRQCRGRLLELFRAAPQPLFAESLDAAWPAGPQRERCLTALVTDGLVVEVTGGHTLPP